MKRLIIFSILAFAGSSLWSQTKEKRDIGTFQSLKVSSAIQVILTMGENESLEIEAKDEELKNVKTEVKGGALVLGVVGYSKNRGEIKAYVNARQIRKLKAEGASQIRLTNTLETDKLEVEASGASVLSLNLKVRELDADIEGASIAKVTGSATILDVDLEGASQFKGADLLAEEVDVDASGASQASVNAEKNIKVKAAGASNVKYKGSPQIKELNSTGASSVKKG